MTLRKSMVILYQLKLASERYTGRTLYKISSACQTHRYSGRLLYIVDMVECCLFCCTVKIGFAYAQLRCASSNRCLEKVRREHLEPCQNWTRVSRSWTDSVSSNFITMLFIVEIAGSSVVKRFFHLRQTSEKFSYWHAV